MVEICKPPFVCSHSSYSLSKLAVQMVNVDLAEKLQQAGSGVTANSLDPGTLVLILSKLSPANTFVVWWCSNSDFRP